MLFTNDRKKFFTFLILYHRYVYFNFSWFPFKVYVYHIYTYISRLSRWCHWKGRKKGTSGSTTMRKYADDGYRWRNIWFFYNTRQCNLGIRLLDDCYGVARVMVIATSLARWLFSAYWLLFLFLLHVFTSVCYRD